MGASRGARRPCGEAHAAAARRSCTPAPPRFTPPERAGARAAPPARSTFGGARVTKIAATNVEGDETAEEAKGAREQRQKAIGDLLGGWSARPPQTTVVIEPAALEARAPTIPRRSAIAASREPRAASRAERVLVPAGRGVYAHTVLAVDSDTNGPIVLEADTGPISGDRMIGTFSKSGLDRLDRQGSRRSSIAASRSRRTGSSLRPIRWRRRSRPASTSIISSGSFCRRRRPSCRASGRRSRSRIRRRRRARSAARRRPSDRSPSSSRRWWRAGRRRRRSATRMTSAIPKGPTVHLAANVSVGVMFLSNLTVEVTRRFASGRCRSFGGFRAAERFHVRRSRGASRSSRLQGRS